jgi:hypothetical protein
VAGFIRGLLACEEVGHAWLGCEQSEGANHVLRCMREGRGTEEFRNFVVYFGKDVDEGEESLVIV